MYSNIIHDLHILDYLIIKVMQMIQSDAENLFNMEKRFRTREIINLPVIGKKSNLAVDSIDGKYEFIVDVNRASFRILGKYTLQKRTRNTIILRRLDIEGSTHQNPIIQDIEKIPDKKLLPYNGKKIKCPHMHIYYEGFDAKWAVPLEVEIENNSDSIVECFRNFSVYCNIVEIPKLQDGLEL